MGAVHADTISHFGRADKLRAAVNRLGDHPFYDSNIFNRRIRRCQLEECNLHPFNSASSFPARSSA